MNKIRKNTLWQGLLYCIAAGLLSWYVTVLTGSIFFISESLQPDGSSLLSADPLRSMIFNGVLPVLILIGGYFVFRRMTKAEAAASCGIFAALQLIMTGAELISPAAGAALLWSAELRNPQGIVSSLLMKTGLDFPLCALISALWPMIFVLFGRRELNGRREKTGAEA